MGGTSTISRKKGQVRSIKRDKMGLYHTSTGFVIKIFRASEMQVGQVEPVKGEVQTDRSLPG